MRSAELVGVAQQIACCGEVGGIGRRGEIAQRRMRTTIVVVVGPVGNVGRGMIEAEEQGFIEKLIPHPAVKTLAEAVLHGLARCDEVPIDAMLSSGDVPGSVELQKRSQTRMAFDVNSVPLSRRSIPACRAVRSVRSVRAQPEVRRSMCPRSMGPGSLRGIPE